MNREQIIQMAREAGIITRFAKMGAGSVFWTEGVDGIVADQLYQFAANIRAATKEEDAKICDDRKIDGQLVHSNAVMNCAAAIRASK